MGASSGVLDYEQALQMLPVSERQWTISGAADMIVDPDGRVMSLVPIDERHGIFRCPLDDAHQGGTRVQLIEHLNDHHRHERIAPGRRADTRRADHRDVEMPEIGAFVPASAESDAMIDASASASVALESTINAPEPVMWNRSEGSEWSRGVQVQQASRRRAPWSRSLDDYMKTDMAALLASPPETIRLKRNADGVIICPFAPKHLVRLLNTFPRILTVTS